MQSPRASFKSPTLTTSKSYESAGLSSFKDWSPTPFPFKDWISVICGCKGLTHKDFMSNQSNPVHLHNKSSQELERFIILAAVERILQNCAVRWAVEYFSHYVCVWSGQGMCRPVSSVYPLTIFVRAQQMHVNGVITCRGISKIRRGWAPRWTLRRSF